MVEYAGWVPVFWCWLHGSWDLEGSLGCEPQLVPVKAVSQCIVLMRIGLLHCDWLWESTMGA